MAGDSLGVAKAPIEARLGIFGLKSVDSLGVMVQKVTKGKQGKLRFDSAVFVPWASILSIDPLTAADDDNYDEDEEEA